MSKPWQRIVAHADMDAFFAAVEQRDDPTLRGRPILVGHEGRGGIVLTASYEARPFGVGSAMPMAKALKQCKGAIVVPPRHDAYVEASKAIMSVFRNFSPDVEPLSLDEAFIDLTGAERMFGAPEEMGRAIKKAVRDATSGLTVTVGISETKYVAKVASGMKKPDGLTIVRGSEARAFLAPLSVSHLWGAGPKTSARLAKLGLSTVGDVAAADPEFLFRELGAVGLHFFELANARDPRPVASEREEKSIGFERTLDRDVRDLEVIERHLRRSADDVARRLRKSRLLAGGVRVKLKTTKFRVLSRQATLPTPTDVADVLGEHAAALLREFDHDDAVRLVGLSAFNLSDRDGEAQLSLFDGSSRRRRLENVVDRLEERFGAGVVVRAEELEHRKR